MTARARKFERVASMDFTLTSGLHAYRGEAAYLDSSTNLVVIGVAASTTLIFLGFFKRDCDATSGAATCQVEFDRERQMEWFANYASDPVVSTDVGALCYVHDGKQVRHTSTSNSPAGLVMKVTTADGVLVDTNVRAMAVTTTPTITNFTNANHGHTNAAGGGVLAAPNITSFASAAHTHANAAGGGGIRRAAGATLSWTGVTCTIGTPGNWTYYKAPVAATQASDIVLGNTGATAGDEVVITSDGSITHTITYYDGTYARTPALSASKTHRVVASFDGAAWEFSYTVGAN